MAKKNVTLVDIGLPTILGALFITLKLCGVIDWSWWWVLSPFWIPVAIMVAFAGVGLLIIGIVALCMALVK